MDMTTSVILLIVLGVFLLGFVRYCLQANVVDWGHGWINFLDGFLRLFIRTYHRFQFQAIPLCLVLHPRGFSNILLAYQ